MNFTPPSVFPEKLTTNIAFHHFLHGNEGELVEKVKRMATEGELWVIGSDDAAGIGALGVSAGLIAEEAQFTVYSVLFGTLPCLLMNARAGSTPSVTTLGSWEATSRLPCPARFWFAVPSKDRPAPRTSRFTTSDTPRTHGQRSVAAAFPLLPGPNEVEIAVEAFDLTELEYQTPFTAFVGRVIEGRSSVIPARDSGTLLSRIRGPSPLLLPVVKGQQGSYDEERTPDIVGFCEVSQE